MNDGFISRAVFAMAERTLTLGYKSLSGGMSLNDGVTVVPDYSLPLDLDTDLIFAKTSPRPVFPSESRS